MNTTTTTEDTTTHSGLSAWGVILAILGVLLGAISYSEASNDTTSWAFSLQTAMMVGGPLLIAGSVLLAASAIVTAIRTR